MLINYCAELKSFEFIVLPGDLKGNSYLKLLFGCLPVCESRYSI